MVCFFTKTGRILINNDNKNKSTKNETINSILAEPRSFLENQFLDGDQEFIQCSTHGALFVVETGECISGPCLGQSLQKVDINVHSDGGIYLNQA